MRQVRYYRCASDARIGVGDIGSAGTNDARREL
jgi:hypothetical protein